MPNTENTRSYGHGAAGEIVAPAKPPVSVRSRLRYRFDNSLAKGAGAFAAWLGAGGVLIALVMTFVRYLTEGTTEVTGFAGFLDRFWNTLGIIFLGGDPAATTWVQRAISLVFWGITVAITGTVIGFITNSIKERMERLKKGKSPIIESNHTLILGWSTRIFPILQQLALANENVQNPLIVVFANEKREVMEDEIESRVGDMGRTRIVTRTGDTTNPRDLERANVDGARSIIVLDADESGDANIVATVLAVRAATNNSATPIIAEVDDPHHAAALRHATGGQVRAVRSHDVIARVTAQASRQPGLAAVVLDLLDFEGDEIYFANVPEQLIGKTYGAALNAFEAASVIGVRSANGVVRVNPASSTVLAAGDAIIAIAQDDDKVIFTGLRDDLAGVQAAVSNAVQEKREPEHLLVLGWSNMGRSVLTELATFLPEGSSVHIAVTPKFVDPSELDDLNFGHVQISRSTTSGDIAELVAAASAKRYDEIIILGYREAINEAEADAITMLTMLQMNQLFDEQGNGVEPTRLVAEILDSRKAELARVAAADDLVVSDNLAALMIAQVSENPALSPVFSDLFDADGASLNVKPIGYYATPGTKVDYATLVAAASSRGESAIGYRVIANAKGDPASGVVLNPNKNTAFTIAAGDGLVLIGDMD